MGNEHKPAQEIAEAPPQGGPAESPALVVPLERLPDASLQVVANNTRDLEQQNVLPKYEALPAWTQSSMGPGTPEVVRQVVNENGQPVERDVPVHTWEKDGVKIQIPDSYKGPVKPEDVAKVIDGMPFKMPVTINIRDDQPRPDQVDGNPAIPGEAVLPPEGNPNQPPEINIWPGSNPLDDKGAEVIRHEWSHLARTPWMDEAMKDMYLVGSMIEDSITGRSRANDNVDENWAVHVGEEFLSPDRSRFEKLVEEQPLKAALIAISLRDQMDQHPDQSPAQAEARRRCDEALGNASERAGAVVAPLLGKLIDSASALEQGDPSKILDLVRATFQKGALADLGVYGSNPLVQDLIRGMGQMFTKLEQYAGGGGRPTEEAPQ